ncbi:MAG TPA: FHA domain-containing protein, partial [Actinomycetales bacterium]|nr:FHA domain-containing protein [Actinomycetales bacterium]
VSVDFESNDELENGRFEVRSETVKGSTAPATSSAARHPIIDVDGHRYLLTGQKTVLGRGSEADIVVNDTGVSRRHLEFRITPERRVIATDLNSTNGTFVEGHPVDAATLVNGNTITIGRTTILFWAAEESDDTGSLD